jgi:HK97 gp10 family phage protein
VSEIFSFKKNITGLAKFRKERPQKARAILSKAAFFIEAEQKKLCPVDTGALRASIYVENRGTFEIAIVEAQGYAFYVEFGTNKMAAQPHARPSAAEGLKYIDDALRALARESV